MLVVSGYLVPYKTTNSEIIVQGYVCIVDIIDVIIMYIYNYIAANETFLNKKVTSSNKCCYLSKTQLIFFQEIFYNNNQTIHLYCSSHYQKVYFRMLNILSVDLGGLRCIKQYLTV